MKNESILYAFSLPIFLGKKENKRKEQQHKRTKGVYYNFPYPSPIRKLKDQAF